MNHRTEVWASWDRQEAARMAKVEADRNFVRLNNLFLAVERGDLDLSISLSNELRSLVGKIFEATDRMREWWMEELRNLPNWLNF